MTAATGASAVTVRWHAAPAAAGKPAAAAAAAPSHLALPAPPAPAADAPPPDKQVAQAAPTSIGRVPRPKKLIEATLLVTGRSSFTIHQLKLIRAVSGVHHVQTVMAGNAVVDGPRSSVLGVNPTRFRAWTPRLTAGSQALWQSIARGELTASFDMGHQANLPLGNTVAVRARHTVPIRIGAFASVGMAGVDAVVSARRAAQLGLGQNTGVVVSAPGADPLALRHSVLSELGPHVHATLLRQVIVIRDSGEFLTRAQINTVLQTAAHQVGKPYVWGAVGPDTFDCSGLVMYSFASVGMSGVDAVVSTTRTAQLGLRDRTGVVLSAPNADPLQLRRTLLAELGPHVHASLLRQVIVIRDAGEFLTRAQINTVLQTAAHQVGKPYVWGAVGPDSFDCSGLVMWSFAAAGVRMPRVSQQQWFAGPHVDYSHALPGDLLFWHYDPTDPTDIDHVAIYAGNGMMLVAPHTGDYVKYVPVPLTNLAGVVRVDPAMAAQIAW